MPDAAVHLLSEVSCSLLVIFNGVGAFVLWFAKLDFSPPVSFALSPRARKVWQLPVALPRTPRAWGLGKCVRLGPAFMRAHHAEPCCPSDSALSSRGALDQAHGHQHPLMSVPLGQRNAVH